MKGKTKTEKRVPRALLVVDVQNDFCPGGSLGVEGGHDVAQGVVDWIRDRHADYELIVFSQDWHEPNSDNGGHIALPPNEPDYVDSWPVHCIQGTTGSDFHPVLKSMLADRDFMVEFDYAIVQKGMGCPAYSAFEGITTDDETNEELADLLREFNVTELDVVGIATDHCVKATVMDALKEEFSVSVLEDLTAGVDEQRTVEAIDSMQAHGAKILAANV